MLVPAPAAEDTAFSPFLKDGMLVEKNREAERFTPSPEKHSEAVNLW